MDERLRALEKRVEAHGYVLLITLLLTIGDTIALLILWGERGRPNYDHIAVSLTVFQTMFAIAALYGFWALRGLTKEKAEEVAKQETARIVPPIVARTTAEYMGTLGRERPISEDDLKELVEGAGKDDLNQSE